MAGSLELRFDQTLNKPYLKGYQLYGFVDSGVAWNVGYRYTDGLSLTSAGGGARFFLTEDLQAGIGVAFPLTFRAADNFNRNARFWFRYRVPSGSVPNGRGPFVSDAVRQPQAAGAVQCGVLACAAHVSCALSPCGLTCAQMLQCESAMLRCDSLCCSAIRFAWGDSGVILSVPSRFDEEAATVEMAIGYFGDSPIGAEWRVHCATCRERQTVCVRKLADGRSEQVKFRRFLSNEAVTVEEMVSHRAMLVAAAATGRHVLAIQDTSEINYQAQSGRKHGLGKVGNGTDVGLFVHPVLAVDARDAGMPRSGRCAGVAPDQEQGRELQGAADRAEGILSLGEGRESKRKRCWPKPPWSRSSTIAKAISTRNGLACRMQRTHLLTRASRDRSLGRRQQAVCRPWHSLPEAHRFTLDLPARPGKRGARTAHMAVRFGRRSHPPTGRLLRSQCTGTRSSCLPSRFASSIHRPAMQICWRLLTTHPVESVEQALTVIGWYRLRWHIEQLFRTLKRQGLRIEQSVVEDGEALEKLVVIALIVATITMQLVLARSPPAARIRQPAACSMPSRSRSCMPCRRSCRGARASSRTLIRPTAWHGPAGPSPASAAGPATTATNPWAPLPCETALSASTASSMATDSQKMCAQVSPCGRGLEGIGAE